MRFSKPLIAIAIALALLTSTIIISCSQNPISTSQSSSLAGVSNKVSPYGGPPGYEEAYVGDTTVRINAIEVKQNPTDRAQADFYEVVYPFDPVTGQELTDYWPMTPQCNPCDHQGNGITPDDFHDHVLDSRPSDPGHGEYNALWRVFVIMPNYTENAEHNTAVNEKLQTLLPLTSEDAINDLLATDVDGIPIANKINIHFYFICAVVGEHAGTHN